MFQNGIEVKHSFPRWKLKLIKKPLFLESTQNQPEPTLNQNPVSEHVEANSNQKEPSSNQKEPKINQIEAESNLIETKPNQDHPDTNQLDSTSTTNDYTIIFAQQVGKRFRYEIKFKDGSTKWVQDTQVDSKIVDNFLRSKSNNIKKLKKLKVEVKEVKEGK